MEIFRLFGSVFLQTNEADRALDATDRRASGVGTTFAKMGATVAKAGAVVGTAAIAAGTAIFGLANASSDTASRVQDMSSKIGISKSGFQEWDYVLSQVGVDVGVLQVGFKKFADSIDDATAGGAKQKQMFSELGISLTDINGKTKTTEQLFNESITALQGMEAGAHKTALANDLFGKSSSEMGAIINGNATDLANAKQAAHDFGLVLTDEAIDAGDTFGDTMDNVKKSIGALATGIGVEVMPIVQTLLDWILQYIPIIKEVVGTAFDHIKYTVNNVYNIFNDNVLPVLKQLWAWIEPNLPAIKQAFMLSFGIMEGVLKGVIDAIKTATEFFIQHWNVMMPILAGIAAGALTFGIYKLSIAAASLATTAWTTVTTIATAAGTAFSAVLAFITSPIGIVVIAIGALVAAGVALYKNWDTVKAFANDLWDGITKAFEGMKTTVLNVWDGIVSGIKGYINIIIGTINGMISTVTNAVNTVIGLLNKIPAVNIPTVKAPSIPKFDVGTNYVNKDMLAMVHEGEAIIPKKYNPAAGNGKSGITLNITGNTFLNDKDIDKFGNLLVGRLRTLGVC